MPFGDTHLKGILILQTYLQSIFLYWNFICHCVQWHGLASPPQLFANANTIINHRLLIPSLIFSSTYINLECEINTCCSMLFNEPLLSTNYQKTQMYKKKWRIHWLNEWKICHKNRSFKLRKSCFCTNLTTFYVVRILQNIFLHFDGSYSY